MAAKHSLKPTPRPRGSATWLLIAQSGSNGSRSGRPGGLGNPVAGGFWRRHGSCWSWGHTGVGGRPGAQVGRRYSREPVGPACSLNAGRATEAPLAVTTLPQRSRGRRATRACWAAYPLATRAANAPEPSGRRQLVRRDAGTEGAPSSVSAEFGWRSPSAGRTSHMPASIAATKTSTRALPVASETIAGPGQ